MATIKEGVTLKFITTTDGDMEEKNFAAGGENAGEYNGISNCKDKS